jgi:hypothetical protein
MSDATHSTSTAMNKTPDPKEDDVGGSIMRFVVQNRSRLSPSVDDDGEIITDGDHVSFSFGIPPIHVVAPVVAVQGELWILTPGYNPTRCKLTELREYVGGFYRQNA